MNEDKIKKITKYLIIFIIIVILVLLFFILKNREDKSSEGLENVEPFFPVTEVDKVNLGSDNEREDSGQREYNNDEQNQKVPILRKISDNPIAGAIIFQEKETENKTIRYMEKGTGHIFETKTDSLSSERILNKTIPSIYSTKWLDADNLIFNYLDESETIKTYSATIEPNASSTAFELNGVFLQDNIKELISYGKDLFFLIDHNTGSKGIKTSIENKKPTQIFSSPLQEWSVANIKDQEIAFTTKTNAGDWGYLFFFNPKNNSFEKILSEKINLQTLINDDKDILYSYNDAGRVILSLYNPTEKIEYTLNIKTFPEKCVWSSDNLFIYCGVPEKGVGVYDLENWYKGNLLFKDNIWEINVEKKEARKIFELSSATTEGIDVTKIQISPNDDFLIFTNKKDYTLWGLEIIKQELY